MAPEMLFFLFIIYHKTETFEAAMPKFISRISDRDYLPRQLPRMSPQYGRRYACPYSMLDDFDDTLERWRKMR